MSESLAKFADKNKIKAAMIGDQVEGQGNTKK
jgi:hypothetical protein